MYSTVRTVRFSADSLSLLSKRLAVWDFDSSHSSSQPKLAAGSSNQFWTSATSWPVDFQVYVPLPPTVTEALEPEEKSWGVPIQGFVNPLGPGDVSLNGAGALPFIAGSPAGMSKEISPRRMLPAWVFPAKTQAGNIIALIAQVLIHSVVSAGAQ